MQRFFHLLLKWMRTYLLLRGRSRRGLPVAAPGGDREAVEEVLAGRGIAPYGEFLKEEGIREKKSEY